MRVLQWIHGLQGGAGVVACDVGNELARRGVPVLLLFADPAGPRRWGTEARSREEMARATFPIEHCPTHDQLIRRVEEFAATHVVYHVWRAEDACCDPMPFSADRVCWCHTSRLGGLRNYDAYLFVCQSQLSSVPAPGAPAYSRVVRNGIDLDRLQNVRQPARDPSAPFRVIRVGGMSSEKLGPDYLSVMQRLARADTEFLFVGDGDGRRSLERRVREVPATALRWRFYGSLGFDDVIRLYRSSDLCLYLTGSHVENHSLALLESMACGVPVVCRSRGGLPEQVEQWRTGVVANSLDEVVEAVSMLRDNSTLRRRLSKECSRGARRYSVELTTDDFLRALDGIPVRSDQHERGRDVAQ